jgi:hypothetical protein
MDVKLCLSHYRRNIEAVSEKGAEENIWTEEG